MAIAGIASGLISGFLLGMLYKIIEIQWGVKIYTLLLNVDFIPLIGGIKWPEYIEFIFHLAVSALIGILYSYIIEKKGVSLSFMQQIWAALLIIIPAIFLYFPLTVWAIKETVSPKDLFGFLLWGGGHILFAFFLALSFKFTRYCKN